MSDATQETATQTETTQTEQSSPSLEDVYREFNATSPPAASGPQQTQPQQTTQPFPTQAQAPAECPDPIQDPAGFKVWMANQQQAGSALMHSFQQVSSQLSQFQRTAQQESLTKDISSAVDIVNESVKLPDKQKKLIEFALEDKARQDPRFKQIWDNRRTNPIAWGRALRAFAGEVGETFSVKVDPQLRQDREALRISQKQSATTRTDANEGPEWHKLPADSAEFQRAWQRAARGYQ